MSSAGVLTDAGLSLITTKLVDHLVANYVAWGSGAGSVDRARTTLYSEESESRVTGTISKVGSNTVQWVATITASGAKTITNAGTFTASTSGTMVMHGTFQGVALGIGDSMDFTFQLILTN